jgi:uncharacterized protein (DUF1015 family)
VQLITPKDRDSNFLWVLHKNRTRKINEQQVINFLEWELYFSDFGGHIRTGIIIEKKIFDFLNGNKS